MVTASSGSSIAGSVYSLVCAVKVVDGLVVVPDVVWMKDGREIINGTNTTVTRTISVVSFSILTNHMGSKYQYIKYLSYSHF